MPFVSTSRERSRRHYAALIILSTLVPLTASFAPAAGQTAPASRAPGDVFRSRTDLVVLQVTVVDAQGRVVPDLRMEDFAIFEEGVRQPVALFDTATAPLDLMLLLDTSASMIGRMDVARSAALELVHRLRPDDRAGLLLFSERVRLAQRLTGDASLVETAVQRAFPGGGTALYEALYIGLREIVRSHPGGGEVRRQALVVLTDGEDTSSKSVALQDVVDVARRSAVTVFTIMPASRTTGDPVMRVMRDGVGAAFAMRTLALETGGRSFAPARSEDLAETYRQIADELGQQYWVAYTPTVAASGFRRVSVQIVGHPDMRARTRSGYVASVPRVGESGQHRKRIAAVSGRL